MTDRSGRGKEVGIGMTGAEVKMPVVMYEER